MSCDIVLIGVGGQGVLTIADLLIRSAFEADLSATYCPTKGMAQRGGFVKAEIRLGPEKAGPRIGEGQADLVVTLERSEGLKGIEFLKPEGTFILFDHVWAPTGVMLGADEYPSREEAVGWIDEAAAGVIVLDPEDLPSFNGQPARPNLFVLGAMIGRTALSELISIDQMEETIAARWPKVAETNLETFRAGVASGGGSGE